jgi:hypothetical protein
VTGKQKGDKIISRNGSGNYSPLYEVSHSAGRHPVEILIAIGRGILPFIPVIVAQTVIIVEVMVMISERYLARRYRQGRAEGQAEGRTEAMAEAQTRLDAWNRLRLEAQERGEVFDQPPPSFITPGPDDREAEGR